MILRSRADGGRAPGAHTLWEMLVVLVLLGAIAALAAPALSTLRRAPDELTRSTQSLVSLLGEARRAAVDQGRTVDVVVDASGGRAWIVERNGDEVRVVDARRLEPQPDARLVADLPRARFTFFPGGHATGDGIVIESAGRRRIVTVYPVNGEAHVDSR